MLRTPHTDPTGIEDGPLWEKEPKGKKPQQTKEETHKKKHTVKNENFLSFLNLMA